MTYLTFHFVFILPPLLLAWAWAWPRLADHRAKLAAFGLPVIALIYTTPWDNYLVAAGVWGYGPERVLATIGYVPVEEYLFFLLQPMLTGLFILGMVDLPAATGARTRERASRRRAGFRPAPSPGPAVALRIRIAGFLFFAAVTAAGVVALKYESGRYLGLILAWAAPVLALQWGWVGAEAWRRRRALGIGILVPTLYLWAADAYAIGNGIWHISERYTTGLALGILPVEEATFFLVTNILVALGVIMFLHPPHVLPQPDTRPEGRGGAAAAAGSVS